MPPINDGNRRGRLPAVRYKGNSLGRVETEAAAPPAPEEGMTETKTDPCRAQAEALVALATTYGAECCATQCKAGHPDHHAVVGNDLIAR